MSGIKYLLYPAALMVTVWGVNGVSTYQPEKSSNHASIVTVQDHGPMMVGTQKQSASPIAFRADSNRH